MISPPSEGEAAQHSQLSAKCVQDTEASPYNADSDKASAPRLSSCTQMCLEHHQRFRDASMRANILAGVPRTCPDSDAHLEQQQCRTDQLGSYKAVH